MKKTNNGKGSQNLSTALNIRVEERIHAEIIEKLQDIANQESYLQKLQSLLLDSENQSALAHIKSTKETIENKKKSLSQDNKFANSPIAEFKSSQNFTSGFMSAQGDYKAKIIRGYQDEMMPSSELKVNHIHFGGKSGNERFRISIATGNILSVDRSGYYKVAKTEEDINSQNYDFVKRLVANKNNFDKEKSSIAEKYATEQFEKFCRDNDIKDPEELKAERLLNNIGIKNPGKDLINLAKSEENSKILTEIAKTGVKFTENPANFTALQNDALGQIRGKINDSIKNITKTEFQEGLLDSKIKQFAKKKFLDEIGQKDNFNDLASYFNDSKVSQNILTNAISLKRQSLINDLIAKLDSNSELQYANIKQDGSYINVLINAIGDGTEIDKDFADNYKKEFQSKIKASLKETEGKNLTEEDVNLITQSAIEQRNKFLTQDSPDNILNDLIKSRQQEKQQEVEETKAQADLVSLEYVKSLFDKESKDKITDKTLYRVLGGKTIDLDDGKVNKKEFKKVLNLKLNKAQDYDSFIAYEATKKIINNEELGKLSLGEDGNISTTNKDKIELVNKLVLKQINSSLFKEAGEDVDAVKEKKLEKLSEEAKEQIFKEYFKDKDNVNVDSFINNDKLKEIAINILKKYIAQKTTENDDIKDYYDYPVLPTREANNSLGRSNQWLDIYELTKADLDSEAKYGETIAKIFQKGGLELLIKEKQLQNTKTIAIQTEVNPEELEKLKQLQEKLKKKEKEFEDQVGVSFAHLAEADEAKAQAKQAKSQTEVAEKAKEEAEAKVKELQIKLQEAETAKAQLQKQAEEQAKEDKAQTEAAEKAKEEAEAKVKELQLKLQEAETAKAQLQKQAEEQAKSQTEAAEKAKEEAEAQNEKQVQQAETQTETKAKDAEAQTEAQTEKLQQELQLKLKEAEVQTEEQAKVPSLNHLIGEGLHSADLKDKLGKLTDKNSKQLTIEQQISLVESLNKQCGYNFADVDLVVNKANGQEGDKIDTYEQIWHRVVEAVGKKDEAKLSNGIDNLTKEAVDSTKKEVTDALKNGWGFAVEKDDVSLQFKTMKGVLEGLEEKSYKLDQESLESDAQKMLKLVQEFNESAKEKPRSKKDLEGYGLLQDQNFNNNSLNKDNINANEIVGTVATYIAIAVILGMFAGPAAGIVIAASAPQMLMMGALIYFSNKQSQKQIIKDEDRTKDYKPLTKDSKADKKEEKIEQSGSKLSDLESKLQDVVVKLKEQGDLGKKTNNAIKAISKRDNKEEERSL